MQVGQLFSVVEASLNETGGGEGVEVLNNEPYENIPLLNGQFNKGQYTKKIYHLASKVPGIVKWIMPKGALEILEEAWNAYPYCKTVLTNPGYMKGNALKMLSGLGMPGLANLTHGASVEDMKDSALSAASSLLSSFRAFGDSIGSAVAAASPARLRRPSPSHAPVPAPTEQRGRARRRPA